GNSITCGFGNDKNAACSVGHWYDHENAYYGYGPRTARALQARWMVSAVSGIGLLHSSWHMSIVMPTVFNTMNMRKDSVKWNFKKYQPNVVTICLGQNDGLQDSIPFCRAYVNFIKKIRRHDPNAKIVC